MRIHRVSATGGAFSGQLGQTVYTFLFSLRFHEAFWVVYLRSRGMSFAAVGLTETIFHIASLLGEVPTGWIADRWGRKNSLIIGRVLHVSSAVVLLQATSLAGFGLGFVLSAFGYNCHSGAYDALVYDDLKADGRAADFTRVMGVLNVVYLVGNSMAALAGGFIAQRALTLLYVVGIGVDTLAIALLIPLRERMPRESRASMQAMAFGSGKGRIDLGRDLRELWATLRNPNLATILLLWAAVSALATSVSFYGQSYMKEMLLPLTIVGATGMAGNLLAAIPSRLAFRLEERFGDRLPLAAGSALIPTAVLGLGLAQMAGGTLGQALVVAALVVVAVLIEGLYPLFSSAANHLVPSERRATVLSSGSMLFSLVMMVVFPVIGLLGDRVGLRWGFTAVGGLGTVLAAFLLLRGKIRPIPSTPRP